jgi:hypothetical protein
MADGKWQIRVVPNDWPSRKGMAGRRAAWKKKAKNLKNGACQVAGASLGCSLFLGKPLRAYGLDVAAAKEHDDLWQLKFD